MKQQDLPGLEVNLEAFLGLTEWKNGLTDPPPAEGWWKTRLISSPDLRQPQRRYWHPWNPVMLKAGMPAGFFSRPVHPGESDEEAEASRMQSSPFTIDQIEWCGLAAEPPMPKQRKRVVE